MTTIDTTSTTSTIDTSTTSTTDTYSLDTSTASPLSVDLRVQMGALLAELCPVPRAEEDRTRGEALGLREEALDLFVKAGAPRRHGARVKAALVAALSYPLLWEEQWEEKECRWLVQQGKEVAEEVLGYLNQDDEPPPPLEERALALSLEAIGLLELEHQGVGGRLNAEGAGTARHPGFDALGNGRKHAADGAAWTAALAEAQMRLINWLAARGWRTLQGVGATPEGKLIVRAVSSTGEVRDEEVASVHPRWAAAYAARKITFWEHFVGRGGPDEMEDEDGEFAPGSIAAWGAVYNRSQEILRPTWWRAKLGEAHPGLGSLMVRWHRTEWAVWLGGILSLWDVTRLHECLLDQILEARERGMGEIAWWRMMLGQKSRYPQVSPEVEEGGEGRPPYLVLMWAVARCYRPGEFRILLNWGEGRFLVEGHRGEDLGGSRIDAVTPVTVTPIVPEE